MRIFTGGVAHIAATIEEDLADSVTSGYKMIQRSGIKVIQQEVVYSLSKREVMTNVSIGASNGNKDFRSARQEFEADSF